ncbi:adenosylmethionine decarboxylase [Acidithiobacillus sp. M4-SHS-6]|uniref:adenosylmethionine decarboxylase n=1 Tax=Acidithiobacillus sp. M4-SHS-6 TaxID=3383024 RepID=UPI0039BE979F
MGNIAHGTHLLLDCWGIAADVLTDGVRLREMLLRAAKAGRCTVVAEKFHRFSPVGITGVLVLAESHLSIHTWPEDGYCAIDAFTCGENTDMSALETSLLNDLKVSRFQREMRERGLTHTPP